MPALKILVIPGSLRTGSLNAKLAAALTDALVRADASVTRISLSDYPLPIYDGDLERDAFPPAARELKRLFVAHHGFLIAAPEYNGSVSGVLKNAIDWASRPTDGENLVSLSAFRGKVAGLMAASIGPFGGLRGITHMRQILSTIHCVAATEQVLLPLAHTAFDEGGQIREELPRRLLTMLVARVIFLAERLRT